MGMNKQEASLVAQDGTEDFITTERKVRFNFFGFHSESTIQQGFKGLLFRNGGVVDTVSPGKRWSRWDPIGRYTIAIIDVRDHPFNIVTSATVRGPIDPDTHQPAPPCKLRVQFQLVMKVGDVERLVNVVQWRLILGGIISDFVLQVAGQLQYDQYNQWSTDLRSYLQSHLVAEAPRAVGVDVLRVNVEDIDGETEADKRQLKIYQEVAKIKVEAVRDIGRAQNERDADMIRAQGNQDRGRMLGINPALLELSRTPGGLEIIRADARLREMAIGMGIIREEAAPGFIPNTSSATPPLGLPGGTPAYAPPPPNASPFSGPFTEGNYSSAPMGPTSAPYPPSSPNPYVASPPSSGMPGYVPSGPVESITARIQRERQKLPVLDRDIYGEGEPLGDANGQLVQPYKLNVILPWGTVVFVLPAGYPVAPPSYVVSFVDPQRPSISTVTSAWSPEMMLNDLLTQIIKQNAS